MEKVPLKETIKNITRLHLSKGNSLFGQCITAVGWVGGTIPEDGENLVELPMADVMNGGVVVGSALAGKRPIYVFAIKVSSGLTILLLQTTQVSLLRYGI